MSGLHEDTPLEIGDPAARHVFVLAHGRGQRAEFMATLVERLALPGRFLLLRADAQSWYPAGFLDPSTPTSPQLAAALACYERVVGGLIDSGVAPERIIVGGFSQGACLTAQWLCEHPRRVGAALLLTGGLIGPDGTTWTRQPGLAGLPVYMATANEDPWVPLERVLATRRWLTESGAAVSLDLFDGSVHEIRDDEVRAIRALVTNLR